MRSPGISESIHAERAILGAVLVSPSLLHAVTLTSSDFGESRLRVVFAAIATLDANGTGIDLVTVKGQLEMAGKITAAGGVAYVAGLVDGLPPVNADAIARWEAVIRDGARLRRVKEAAEIMAKVADETGNGASALEEARRLLDETERHVLAFDLARGAGVREALQSLRQPSIVRGLATGIPDLDRLLGPLVPGNLVIVAARPGVGKSALAAQVAEDVSRTGKGVLFVSAEMSRAEISRRRILNETGLGETVIGRGLSVTDARDIEETVEAIAARPFYVIEGTPTPTEIRAQARMVGAQPGGLGLVVVDYLQLLSPTPGKFQTREGAVAETSRALKKLAGELGVPVLAACQLNRDSTKREDPEPRLADLRESGAIEQDADLVLMLHRIAESEERVNAILEKARNRKRGRVELRFRGEIFRFESTAPEPGSAARSWEAA